MSKHSFGIPPIRRREGTFRRAFGFILAAGSLALTSPLFGQTIQEVHIQWTTTAPLPPGAPGQRLGQPGGHLFSVLGRQTMSGRLPRQREPELGSDKLMIIARDANGKIVNWQVVGDPRVLRAETAGPQGELSGRVFYRDRADFLFALPDDPSIARIEFYRPRWAGANFDLDLLGAVAVP
jgi:hypothetical protein